MQKGVVKFFKVPVGKLILKAVYPNSLVTPLIFPLASIWRLKAASNLEAVKSTLLNKSCSNQKILTDLLLKLYFCRKFDKNHFYNIGNYKNSSATFPSTAITLFQLARIYQNPKSLISTEFIRQKNPDTTCKVKQK